MKKQTLVIHPNDPSTNFLSEIYRGRGFTEIHEDFDSEKLKSLIRSHDRIIMLGHGFHHGLLHYTQTIIDASFVPYLKDKELVGIWCFAKTFFTMHQLPGFFTDMFISETEEAMVMGVPSRKSEIDFSNKIFAQAVRKNLFHPKCYERVLKHYCVISTTVAKYNQARIYYRDGNGILLGKENDSPIDQLSQIVLQNPELLNQLIGSQQLLNDKL